MRFENVLGGNGRVDDVVRKARVAGAVMKGRIEQLPDETKEQLKSDFEALKTQVKDHVELTREGAQALRSQLDAARADGTLSEEEKEQLKSGAEALWTQAQEFRKEDRASFKSFIEEVKAALKANKPASPVTTPAH